MQLKNTKSGNIQLFFYKTQKGVKEPILDFVHIPGGATVEIEDSVFEACRKSKTRVQGIKLVETQLVEDTIGAQVQTDKKPLVIKEYYETGETREVSLVDEMVKDGTLVILQRVAVSQEQIDKFLNGQGISIKDMSAEQKLALYDKLA